MAGVPSGAIRKAKGLGRVTFSLVLGIVLGEHNRQRVAAGRCRILLDPLQALLESLFKLEHEIECLGGVVSKGGRLSNSRLRGPY
ncbi:uncharacterized protein BDW43DRAFT_274030 [Aspergillus alliaceus]|uniref:uncharacterized protein n=1 Tax=Petromyces alliaceus TaxID=209559 RepID=UPI0012A6C3E4|nr:uncharacterized protein BDW43DRAFT_274030 [Aspergillus alliaceus]KAB8234382.1 hypothetical protein BDW43DRAFT_274030 [Aspergillus alliaceus]